MSKVKLLRAVILTVETRQLFFQRRVVLAVVVLFGLSLLYCCFLSRFFCSYIICLVLHQLFRGLAFFCSCILCPKLFRGLCTALIFSGLVRQYV